MTRRHAIPRARLGRGERRCDQLLCKGEAKITLTRCHAIIPRARLSRGERVQRWHEAQVPRDDVSRNGWLNHEEVTVTPSSVGMRRTCPSASA